MLLLASSGVQELYEFAMVVQLLDAMMYGVVREMLQASGTALEANAKRLRHCGYVGMHTARRHAGLVGRGNVSLTAGVGTRAPGRRLAGDVAGAERTAAGSAVPGSALQGDDAALDVARADGWWWRPHARRRGARGVGAR